MFLFSLMIDRIGHFRIAPTICVKTRLSAKPLICKGLFLLVQMKQERFCTQPRFQSEGFLELGNDLLFVDTLDDDSHPSGSKAPNSKSAIIAVVNISVNRKLYYFFAARNQVIRYSEVSFQWDANVLVESIDTLFSCQIN